MKESAQIAHSYIRSIAKDLGLDKDVFDRNDIHYSYTYCQRVANPYSKDGPSAGITICSALISCLINKSIDVSTAMTGELTLRGRVLAVGGIKEKVLAAHRAGYTRVLLPEENKKNLEDIPANIKKKIEFIFVKNMKDVINIILGVKIK